MSLSATSDKGLKSVVDLTNQIVKDGDNPVSGGGYADIWRGTWKNGLVEKKVAIKVLRLFQIHNEESKSRITKRLQRELKIWLLCEHDNILPLYGVASYTESFYSMICPWMENGNLNKYLGNHESLQLSERLQMLHGVAAGLKYLHSQSIVHGDLTGANILIGDDKKPHLSDFGLSQVKSEIHSSSCLTSTVTGAIRWSAPELFLVDTPDVKTSCDLYSYGSVMLQTLSGRIPYHEIKPDPPIFMRLINRQKPARPAEITKDNHWDLIEKCWSDEPADRPTAGMVLQVVQQFLEEATSLVDPCSQRHPQYSPTTNSYTYDSSADHQRTTSGYPSSYGMGLTSPHPASQSQPYSSPVPISHQNSLSTSNAPLSYGQQLSAVSQYYPQEQQMVVELPVTQSTKRRRESGFRRVRDARDLRPYINPQPTGRRMDSNGVFLSPLRQLTTNVVETYHICNPQFRYESTHNPRRVLTNPSKPAHNEGYDNNSYDYILYVNDWLGTEDGNKYLILDILGDGRLSQVVKCQNMKTHEIVAVKVVKNKPRYFNQSMMEVTILELLTKNCDPQDEHHILRLLDSFVFRNHMCLVFELLSSNLCELIEQNQFQGLSMQLTKVFTVQLLDALSVLKDVRLIHCDLKPENILLKSLQSPEIKLIDFGSACHERQTVYTYIQSIFYRSPEVLLGLPYNAAIDMWSLGCVAIELFVGLPLFPGTSEYNQIARIVEMIGMPPAYMLDIGKQTSRFFDSYADLDGQKKYRLKSLEEYSWENNTNEQPGKQYFKMASLPDVINTAPFKPSSLQGREMEKELSDRVSFIDFCQGLLNLNPIERWSPQQARMHPFITGEKFTKPFVPVGQISSMVTT